MDSRTLTFSGYPDMLEQAMEHETEVNALTAAYQDLVDRMSGANFPPEILARLQKITQGYANVSTDVNLLKNELQDLINIVPDFSKIS